MTRTAEQAGQTEQATLPEELVALLVELEDTVRPDALTPAATFESLGMDSLGLMELVVAAEERFGITLPDTALDLAPHSTLADAAEAFRRAS